MGRHKRIVGSIPVIRNPKLISAIKSSEALVIDANTSSFQLATRLSEWEDLSIEGGDADYETESESNQLVSSPLLLMVTARSDPTKLIFPKGGLHKKEDATAGALRETWEEAGVTGSCIKTILEPNEHCEDTKFWCFEMNVAKIHKCWPEKHQRRRVWLDTTNLDSTSIKKLHTKSFSRKVLKLWLKAEKRKDKEAVGQKHRVSL